MSAGLKLLDPKSTTTGPDEIALRNALRLCVEERDAAHSRRDKAKGVVERCRLFIGELERRVAQFEALDRKIAAKRAATFREALCDDVSPTLTASAELTKSTAARIDTANQFQAAKDALDGLEAELDTAEKRLSLTNANVTTAAKKIVAAHAGALAVELRDKEHAAALCRRRLLGVTQMRGPHIGPYPIDALTASVLRGDTAMTFSHAEPEDTAHFDRYLTALQSNAYATPEEA